MCVCGVRSLITLRCGECADRNGAQRRVWIVSATFAKESPRAGPRDRTKGPAYPVFRIGTRNEHVILNVSEEEEIRKKKEEGLLMWLGFINHSIPSDRTYPEIDKYLPTTPRVFAQRFARASLPAKLHVCSFRFTVSLVSLGAI